jgi:hypothetical protein
MFNNGITLDEAVAALRQEYAQILSETADMVRRDAVRQQPIGATW